MVTAVRDAFDRDAAFARVVDDELDERYRVPVRTIRDEKLRTSGQGLANWIPRTGVERGCRHTIELNFDGRVLDG